jgi:hypothetical protein
VDCPIGNMSVPGERRPEKQLPRDVVASQKPGLEEMEVSATKGGSGPLVVYVPP